MPIYEFRCEACGARFEDLVPAGTGSAPCPACGEDRSSRAWAPQAAAPKLVKTPREARKQERANARLKRRAKERFSEARRAARERSPGAGGGDGGS